MGAGESREPITQKLISEGDSNKIRYGLCEMQGWRVNMEDATIAEIDEKGDMSVFGVLDGHGGKLVSKFVAKFFTAVLKRLNSFQNEKYDQALIEAYIRMDELLKKEVVNTMLRYGDIDSITQNQIMDINTSFDSESALSFKSLEIKTIKSSSPLRKSNPTALESKNHYNVTFFNNVEKNEDELVKEYKSKIGSPTVIISAEPNEVNALNIDDFDSKFKKEIECEKLVAHNMGTTANICFIKNNVFYLANVGDSRAVLFKGGKAIRLNEEHKPSLVSEQSRISKSGMSIVSNRIDGKLNLTRAIGDFMFKKNTNLKRHEQAVTVYPEVNKMKITKDMEFIVIGCDGVWDCVDETRLCEYISNSLREGKMIPEILSSLFDQILSKSAKSSVGTDNMSCIIVQFFHQ